MFGIWLVTPLRDAASTRVPGVSGPDSTEVALRLRCRYKVLMNATRSAFSSSVRSMLKRWL